MHQISRRTGAGKVCLGLPSLAAGWTKRQLDEQMYFILFKFCPDMHIELLVCHHSTLNPNAFFGIYVMLELKFWNEKRFESKAC